MAAWFVLLTKDVGRFYFGNLVDAWAPSASGVPFIIHVFALGTTLVSMLVLYLLIWLD
jgi:hypothetical protein